MLKGKLVVTVDDEQDLSLPGENGVEKIGYFEQNTTQYIDKDKAQVLVDFLTKEKASADKQLEKLTEEYNLVKDLGDIDESVQAGCIKALGKGNKKFKEEMKILAQYIQNLQRKKQFKQQIDYLTEQLVMINSDLDKLLKAIK